MAQEGSKNEKTAKLLTAWLLIKPQAFLALELAAGFPHA
jgi:hypothetical protein